LYVQSDVNVQNMAGNTALHYAIMYKHAEVAEVLMRSGADEALPNRHGQMPFDMEGRAHP
jgi:ankyrin repeat protein